MNRVVRTLASVSFLVLALVVPAQAADHLMRVTEVHPSPGNPGLAFVELQDASAEAFPSASYTLASLDAGGTVIGQQTFIPPYGFARSAEPFLVGAAGVQPRDATLSISLAGARKVCFYRGPGTADPIHCLAFGSVPDGQSAQLTASESVVIACPTPDAANRQSDGTCQGAVTTPGAGSPNASPAPDLTSPSQTQGAVTTPGAGSPNASPAPDLTSPSQTLSGKKMQRLDRLAITIVVNEASAATVGGSVKVRGKKLAFKEVTRSARAGTRVTVRLRLSKKNASAARAALRAGHKLTAKISSVARDAGGNKSTARRAIRLGL